MPLQVLFLDWGDSYAYRYSSSSMQQVGLDVDIVQDSTKGTILLAECSLAHRMILKKFRLNTSIKFLLDSFTYQSFSKIEKTLPRHMMILNRNSDFDKGVNKVLKTTTMALVEMMPAESEQIVQFICERFSVGSLTCRNLISYIGFLEKVSMSFSTINIQVKSIFRMLAFKGFFKAHTASFTAAQLEAYNEKIITIKEQAGGEAFNFLEVAQPANESDAGDAMIQLVQQLTNSGNCYKTDKCLALLRQISGSQDGGWDNSIRIPMLGG